MASRSTMSVIEDVAPPTNTEVLETELRYELGTIIGTSSAFLCFFIITFFLISMPNYVILLPAPLLIYNFMKVLYCSACMCLSTGPDKTVLIKDLFEAILMIGYYVGITMKMLHPTLDSTFLIAPIVTVFISRIVISMGLYQEFQGVYAICRSSFRIFLLLMTFNVTFKIEGYFSMSWGQTFWPYWLLFAALVFFSIAALIVALNICFCPHRGQKVNFDDVVATVWLAYTFIGFSVASFSLSFLLTQYFDSGEGMISTGCLMFAMYFVVLLVLTILSFQKITQFGMKMTGVLASRADLRPVPPQYPQAIQVKPPPIPEDMLTTEQVRMAQTVFKVVDRSQCQHTQNRESDVSLNSSKFLFKDAQERNNNSSLDVTQIKIDVLNEKAHSERVDHNPQDISKVHHTESGNTRPIIKKSSINSKIEEKQKCVICCSNDADGVLLPCCHGGLCFECGKTLGKQNATCHFCRKNFWQVLKICLNEDQTLDFFRVLEMHNVISYPLLSNTIKSML